MNAIHEHDLPVLLNALNEGVCSLNGQGELLYANKTAALHWQPEHSLSAKLLTCTAVQRGLAGEQVIRELVRVGEHSTLLVNVVPIYAATGSVSAVAIVTLDASEHVVLERHALSALETLSQAVVDTVGIADLDETLRRLASLLPQVDAFDNSVAFRVQENTLVPLAFFGSGQQSYEEWQATLQAMKLSVEHALHRSSPAYLYAVRLARPLMIDFATTTLYGNPRNLRAALYAPVLIDGRVVGLLGIERQRSMDVTGRYFPQWSVDFMTAIARLASMALEQRALLDRVERGEKEAQAAQDELKRREEFLSLATHELKNPLTAIRGQAQVLRRRIRRSIGVEEERTQVEHELLDGLQRIEHQTLRLEQMVNTLLESSRIDLDQMELELLEVDLAQLAKEVLESFLPLAPTHDLQLFVEGHKIDLHEENAGNSDQVDGEGSGKDTPSLMVRGDALRLEQVIANLVSNAIRYSSERSTVTVKLRHERGKKVELSVHDQGIGIPPQEQARITERFYRGEEARRYSARGMGLGLYLVKAIVEQHGGALKIRSEGVPGKGSTFTITLPEAESQE